MAFVIQLWITGWNEKLLNGPMMLRNRSDDLSHHKQTLGPSHYSSTRNLFMSKEKKEKKRGQLMGIDLTLTALLPGA